MILRVAADFRLFTRAATLASIKIRDLSITEVHRPPQSEASSLNSIPRDDFGLVTRTASGRRCCGACNAGRCPCPSSRQDRHDRHQLPLTGADARGCRTRIKTARCWRSRRPTRRAASPATRSRSVLYDSGTATAGQYDPAQAATNARKIVADDPRWWPCRAADERRGQGHGADPEPGRPGHHHAQLDQSRHHRSEVRRAVPARRARRSISAR